MIIRKTLGHDIRWGVMVGAGMAGFFSAFACVMFAIRGPRLVAVYHLSLGGFIGFYFLAGILGGFLVGVLKPIAKWHLGAVALGAIAFTPAYFGAALVLEGNPASWGGSQWFLTLILPLVVGGFAGDKVYLTLPKAKVTSTTSSEPPKRKLFRHLK